MKRITADDLRAHGACEDQVRVFKEIWPKGAAVTLANVRKAIALYLDLEWVASHLLGWSARRVNEYSEAVEAAGAAYRKATAPAWAACENAIALAWATHQKAIAPAGAAYEEALARAFVDAAKGRTDEQEP